MVGRSVGRLSLNVQIIYSFPYCEKCLKRMLDAKTVLKCACRESDILIGVKIFREKQKIVIIFYCSNKKRTNQWFLQFGSLLNYSGYLTCLWSARVWFTCIKANYRKKSRESIIFRHISTIFWAGSQFSGWVFAALDDHVEFHEWKLKPSKKLAE